MCACKPSLHCGIPKMRHSRARHPNPESAQCCPGPSTKFLSHKRQVDHSGCPSSRSSPFRPGQASRTATFPSLRLWPDDTGMPSLSDCCADDEVHEFASSDNRENLDQRSSVVSKRQNNELSSRSRAQAVTQCVHSDYFSVGVERSSES